MEPFRLERFFARHEFAVPHLLCTSDCESMSVRELLALEPTGLDELLSTSLGYTVSNGAPELRSAIASLYAGITAEDVLVHAGAEEAIYGFARAVLRPGDRVVVQSPCYQSLSEVARDRGCEVLPWPMRFDDGRWGLRIDELLPHFERPVRAIVFNTPHNPTGWQMPPDMQTELVELAEQHGAMLFSDEVYRGLEQDPDAHLPATCDLDGNAISLGVMSKSYGLAGLRIGWVATRNREALEAMAAHKDYTSICSSAPSERLALLALRHGERLIERNRAIIATNIGHFRAFQERHPGLFEGAVPEAGPIAFPRVALGGLGTGSLSDWCDRLAREAGVLLLPGELFDAAWRSHVRLGFGRKSFAESLERLERWLG